jgi:ribonuclease HI
MKLVVAATDGACRRNPGPGGWAYVLRFGRHVKQKSGFEPDTTNNRMELTAAIRALEALTEPCLVHISTDSKYVQRGVESWLGKWKRNGWMTLEGQPVLNQDLWKALDAQVARHRTLWHWIKGHAGHEDNELCDRLAREAAMNGRAG